MTYAVTPLLSETTVQPVATFPFRTGLESTICRLPVAPPPPSATRPAEQLAVADLPEDVACLTS